MRSLSTRSRRAAFAAGLVLAATAATAALAPSDLRDRLAGSLSESTQATPAVPPSDVAQPVRASVIRFRPSETTVSYTGSVRPRFLSTMGFRVSGKIATRLVDVGDRVAEGQVIATLDDADFDAALRAARAEVSAARTDLDRALAAIARTRTLRAEGHVSEAALERTESDAAAARARLDRAEAAVVVAANQSGYTRLVAEGPGVVTEIRAEAGQVVSAGQPVAVVARTDALDAEISLPEQKRADLDGGRAVGVLWGDEGAHHDLTVREVSPDVDPATRTYRVRLAFPPGVRGVDLGRTVTVTLGTGASDPVATLPLAAVFDDGEGASVWRIGPDGTAVERVAVELVSVGETTVAIRGPLDEGEHVVSLGAQRIDPDRPVRVVETAQDAGL